MMDKQSDALELELTMITILVKGNNMVDYVAPSFPVFRAEVKK